MSEHDKTQSSEGPPSYSKALAWGAKVLSANSKTAQLDALLLLSFVLKLPKEKVLANSEQLLERQDLLAFQDLISRRRKYEPIAYLVGSKEFYGIDFEVNKDVLVPRPETELLVERALSLSEQFPTTLRILDLGTGSGCIALALAHTLKQKNRKFEIVAADISKAALQVATRNAARLGLSADVHFIESNWCSNLNPKTHSYEIIISNPPYLSIHGPRGLELAYEPQNALFSEQSGLADITTLIQQMPKFLQPGGYFLCELGVGKKRWVKEMLNASAINWESVFHGQQDDQSGCTVLEAKYQVG